MIKHTSVLSLGIVALTLLQSVYAQPTVQRYYQQHYGAFIALDFDEANNRFIISHYHSGAWGGPQRSFSQLNSSGTPTLSAFSSLGSIPL